MSGKWKAISCIIIISLLLSSCMPKDGKVKDQETSSSLVTPVSSGYQVEEVEYEKDGISATYPRIVSGAPEDKLKVWNEIIEKDFNKILQIYSFNPFPELKPTSAAPPIILNINNEVKINNGRFFSVLYTAAYNSKYSAHPSELVYTTNIDMENSKRLTFSDIIKLDANFVNFIKKGDFISSAKENKELNAAIKDYISQLSNQELINGFKSADIIGGGNEYGIFTYLTPEKLGISLSVPNYLGDHIEIERPYSELSDFMKINVNPDK